MDDIAQRTRTPVHATRKAQHKATQLLAAAKRAVQIAIEDSEEAALDYLAAQQSQSEPVSLDIDSA